MDDSEHSAEEQTAADAVAEVASDSTLAAVARGAAVVLGFVATFILGRYFGPEALGRYSLARTIVMIGAIVTALGFDQGLAKYVPRFENAGEAGKLGVLTRTVVGYTGMFAVVVAVGLAVASEFLAEVVFDDPGMVEAIWWAAAILVPFTALRVFQGLYRGMKSFGVYALVRQGGLRLLLVAGLGVAWGTGWVGADGALGAYFVAAVAAAVWCVVYSGKFGVELAPMLVAESEEGRELQREVVAFSSTMIFAAMTTLLMRRVDILMAGVFLESARVGIYRLAATVSVFAGFFMQASNHVFSAFISELFDAGRRELLEETYSALTKWVLALTLPILVSFWVFPEPIVGFFGREYVDGAEVLQILSVGAFCNVAVGATGYMLVMGEYERLQLANNCFVAVLNIVLNWLMIPRFGIVGAAVATAISTATIAALRLTQIRWLFDLFPYDATCVSIPLSMGVMAACAFAVRPVVDGVPAVLAVTAVNLGLGLGVMYLCRTELDEELGSQVLKKIGGLGN